MYTELSLISAVQKTQLHDRTVGMNKTEGRAHDYKYWTLCALEAIVDETGSLMDKQDSCPTNHGIESMKALKGMTPEFQDKLAAIEARQSKILLEINSLETHGGVGSVVPQDHRLPSSAVGSALSDSRLVAASPTVSGEPLKRLFRWGHSACTGDGSNLIIFGGFGGSERHSRLNDILQLDVRNRRVCSVIASGTPDPMMAHTASKVADGMIIIGGRRSPTCILNTVSVLHLKTFHWSHPEVSGAKFPPRHRHAAAVVGSNIYVYGGLVGTDILGDLYLLDTNSWAWLEVLCHGNLPSARFSHSLVAHRGKLYLFGGRGRNAVYSDLHVLDLETLMWSEAEVGGIPPSRRYSHTMTAVGDYLLVIGGCPITSQGSELVFLDVVSMTWVRLPISWPKDCLLVRHSATVVGESLLLVGGGAACFAFGTNFSPTFRVSLEPFLHQLTARKDKNSTEVLYSDESSPDMFEFGKQELSSWAWKVDKDKAKVAKDALKQLKWLDPSRKSKVIDQSNQVAFPILEVAVPVLLKDAHLHNFDLCHQSNVTVSECSKLGIDVALESLFACGGEVVKLEMLLDSKHHSSPQDTLQKSVAELLERNYVALSLLEELPKRWERLGDMVILPAGSLCSPVWSSLGETLWRTIALSLGASRVARQAPIASTRTRDSQLQLLYGNNGWVEPKENGIFYCFDALKCMFSSGNVSEKLRIANMQCHGATVVDLFAGIGYYVLPFLLKAGAQKVYACEWNPHAVVALRHNLAVNGVEAMCEVIEGDNRITAPQGVADIVSLGLLPTSEASWPVAVKALRPEGGILLVHENVKDSDEKVWTDYLLKSISILAVLLGRKWDISLLHLERVKWYAPHVRHIVADVRCGNVPDFH